MKKKIDLSAFKALALELRMKGKNAQTGQTQANWDNRPQDAAYYGGTAYGWLSAANDLDKLIQNLEKE